MKYSNIFIYIIIITLIICFIVPLYIRYLQNINFKKFFENLNNKIYDDLYKSILQNTKNDNFETNTQLKFLHLVLYSDDTEYYRCMYNTTSKYYKNFFNVKTIYYAFSNEIETDYLLKDDILYIKGNESYVPGILEKTIKAFEYFQNEYTNFDYIVRSNISTIVNFNLLNSELILNPFDYGGSAIHYNEGETGGSATIDHGEGTFIDGTGIVFSKKAFAKLLEKKEFFNMKLVDDLAIGRLFKDHIPEMVPTTSKNQNFKTYVDDYNTKGELINNIENKEIVFYRNKNTSREKDCAQMNTIISHLNAFNYNKELKIILIVSRYNENVEWTKQLPNVIIYNKGKKLEEGYNEILLENVGCESHTYYKYICDTYDNLEDYTIFLQGNPFDHSPNIINNLQKYLNNKELNINFEFISEKIINSNLTGCHYHPGLPLTTVYEKLFNEKKEDMNFEFGEGSQFIVSKKQILKRPKEFYLKIVEMLQNEIKPIEGYVIERFHKLIFN